MSNARIKHKCEPHWLEDAPLRSASFSWLDIASLDASVDTSDTLVGDMLRSAFPEADGDTTATAPSVIVARFVQRM